MSIEPADKKYLIFLIEKRKGNQFNMEWDDNFDSAQCRLEELALKAKGEYYGFVAQILHTIKG